VPFGQSRDQGVLIFPSTSRRRGSGLPGRPERRDSGEGSFCSLDGAGTTFDSPVLLGKVERRRAGSWEVGGPGRQGEVLPGFDMLNLGLPDEQTGLVDEQTDRSGTST
jgi:hypothetical protein